MQVKTLNDVNYAGKDILLRVDFNVPSFEGKVTDKTRIEAVLPTIKKLQEAGARIALFSHLGRPKGQPNPKYSLEVVMPILKEFLPGTEILFKTDYTTAPRAPFWADLGRGGIILCENLRFHAEEEQNDLAFAKTLAALGDVYVNDAFAASHRAHASIVAITKFLPSCAGLLLSGEVQAINAHFLNAKKPLMAVIGGAKVSSKIDVLNALLEKVDILAIGGGMANSFLKAQGLEIGKSLFEEEALPLASEVVKRAETLGKKLLLPVDVVTAREFAAFVPTEVKKISEVGCEDRILDIGPLTTARFIEAVEDAQTLLWNGPLGAFEIEPFDQGTLKFAHAAAERTRSGKLISLTGGGDSVAALIRLNLVSAFTYVSTGGGAFLEFLEGKTLPGLAVLTTENHIKKNVL